MLERVKKNFKYGSFNMTWVGSAKGSDLKYWKLILDKIFKLSDRYLENFKRTVGETEIIWANENQGQPLIASFTPKHIAFFREKPSKKGFIAKIQKF